jgi:pyridoxal phosphate enzyme (YggS family)
VISADQLAANLRACERAIARACERAGRSPADVTLLPVTKLHPPETVAALMDLGLHEFGESRVQDLRRKKEWFAGRDGPRPRWHMIGTLQRNKVRQLVEANPVMIHSTDSAELLREIERRAGQRGLEIPCLIEVNVSGEAAKHGLAPDEVAPVLRPLLPSLRQVRVLGLMTMAPLEAEPEATRPVFRGLRTLRDRLQDELDTPLPVLSMGMTNDFEVAIEEGSTLIRVGTALLGARFGSSSLNSVEGEEGTHD